MFLLTTEISDETPVNEIVARDYRTAAVFLKYGIEYCCGGKIPLQLACELQGLDKELVKQELEEAMRHIHISNSIDFGEWNVDFLVD